MPASRYLRRELLLFFIIGAIVLVVGLRAPIFLTYNNALDILSDSAILAILVLGQMMVLISRGIDLSVASNLALTGMVCALIGKAFPGVNIVVLITVALVIGALLGVINGWLITVFDLPPIVVTLGTLSVYRGAIFVASNGAWVSDQDIHEGIKGLPREVWLGIPSLIWFALLITVLVVVLLKWRKEGREIYALGGNPHAASYLGIPAKRRLLMVYTLSGAFAGLAGLLWVGRYSIAYTELAAGFELTVIAACVIGGVSIGGGVGTVLGAMLGVLFVGVLNGALPVIQVSPFWQQAISGAVILISVVVNVRSERSLGRPILKYAGASQ